jgi:hypothetical protein
LEQQVILTGLKIDPSIPATRPTPLIGVVIHELDKRIQPKLCRAMTEGYLKASEKKKVNDRAPMPSEKMGVSINVFFQPHPLRRM